MYGFRSKLFFIFLGACFAGMVATVFPSSAFAQDQELFSTASIERSVSARFKLSPTDLRLIHPEIEQENRSLVLSYLRFSESSTDFLCLWTKVRIERHEAESSANLAALSSRQKMALAKALDALERRLLEMWLDEYVSGITGMLELDRIQMDCISKVFQRESEQRRRVIETESKTGVILNADWDKITGERDKYLRAILDPLQFHDYTLLNATIDLIA
jgi:hypothetical protein